MAQADEALQFLILTVAAAVLEQLAELHQVMVATQV
jgi:hypothetical protein